MSCLQYHRQVHRGEWAVRMSGTRILNTNQVGRLRNWVRQLSLLTQLRIRMKVELIRRHFVRLYAIDCSCEERAQLAAMTDTEFGVLGQDLARWFRHSGAIPAVRLLCFGANARRIAAPRCLHFCVREPFGVGAWLDTLKLGIVFFRDGMPARGTILHETTHGLMDLISGGFPYLTCIKEGFAQRTEYVVPHPDGETEWRKISMKRPVSSYKYFDAAEAMSIRELLAFDVLKHWRRDMKAFSTMTTLSFWFLLFLERIGEDTGVVEDMLYETRKENLTSPDAVYDWIVDTLKIDAGTLEDRFLSFCATGIV
jgi:hypothetical protein